MKKVIAGAIIALAFVFIYKSCSLHEEDEQKLREQSVLIQEQISNVSKLVVIEGHYAEVYNYADSKQLFGSLITADKKALVVVNAEVTVSYDLSQLDYELDIEAKTVRLRNIPDPLININPDLEYYDVTADYFNPFNADDYNNIKRKVGDELLNKVKNSTMLDNAENRLLSELSKLLLLTNAMDWTLEYRQEAIQDTNRLEILLD
ncbi:MAG: DUF4230 domain-containing protein [Croceitalea sp.]|nr:DUF4230 domain-containing protein [Croceitalea sp.]MBT8238003.1 DUF4230 domain-containing protein [Croceitalea sp.]NNC35253.1 DUF4230 domain-containing protein [Croceitalea sp.]NNL09356.1 DUF4230 domain-containing protein [Croceitalea sp.]NNM18131.1 DUF4230 domain-containing protein [Croceitalea sp.]